MPGLLLDAPEADPSEVLLTLKKMPALPSSFTIDSGPSAYGDRVCLCMRGCQVASLLYKGLYWILCHTRNIVRLQVGEK